MKLPKSKTTMTLYHVTTKENAENIKDRGLIPTIGERSRQAGETKPKVYLFRSKTDMENALMNWLADEFDDNAELVCVTFEIPRTFTTNLEYNITAQFEITSHVTIPPEFITDVQDI